MITSLYDFFFGNQVRKYFVLLGSLVVSQIICVSMLSSSNDSVYVGSSILLSLVLTGPGKLIYDHFHDHPSLSFYGRGTFPNKEHSERPVAKEKVQCLLTHKCGQKTHELARRLRKLLTQQGVDLLVDPFYPGDDINTRINTLGIDSLLFLSDPESLQAYWCRQELAIAQKCNIPIFTAPLEGNVPDEINQRICLDLGSLEGEVFEEEAGKLGASIKTRGLIYRKIRSVPKLPPEEGYQIAQTIADEEDQTALAEFVPQLGELYSQLTDPNIQSWIATSLGCAGTSQAQDTLLELATREDDHPLALYAVKKALAMVGHKIS